MPRKKKATKEEIQAEINRRVEEQLKIDREVNHMEEVEKFLDDALKALCYHYFYGHLKFKYFFDTAKLLIDNSGLSEEQKEEQRHSFASDIVFSRGGVREEEWNNAMESVDRISKALRGQD